MLTEGKQSGSNVEIRAAGFILSNLSNLSVIFELDAKKIFNLREGEREREKERERGGRKMKSISMLSLRDLSATANLNRSEIFAAIQ